MAQELKFKKLIDVDNTVVKPSPQRVRNILTLDEKIAVIKAYEQRPMYKKVARMFNCSWEQIKNIITNRATIMEFYHAAKIKTKYEDDIAHDPQMDVKERKTKFLGECVYECMQRWQYHANMPITEELIRHKALEFQDVLNIPGFFPTKKWLNLFKATYNFSFANKQISIYTEPQSSLEIKDIMTFCTARSNKISKYKKHEVKNVEYEAKRLRKLNFLQKALKEFLLRVKFHHKSMKMDTNSLREVALNFNEILKVQDFEPSKEWIDTFRKQYDSETCLVNAKRPPLSLDLKDILSYCSRMQNKAKDNTITLTPKETALQMRVLPKQPEYSFTEDGLKFQQNSIIYLDEGAGEKDIKPDIAAISVKKIHLDQPPPLKIRKIESINNDPVLQCKIPANIELRKIPTITIKQVPQEPPKEVAKQAAKPLIYIQQKVPANQPKENVARLIPQPTSVEIKKENLDDSNYILPTNPPQLRLQHAHQLYSSSSSPPLHHHHHHYHNSPPKSSSHSLDDHDNEELPRHVTSFKDVLLLLKPLEEYAMLKENYRAIGLLTQLEEVLKNDPEDSAGDEEFIG